MDIIDSVIDTINALFPNRTDASQARIDAGTLRTGFQNALRATQATFASLGIEFTSKRINGLVLNKNIVVQPIALPAGSGDYRYLRIAQLAQSNGGLYDLLSVRLQMGQWSSASRGTIEATFGNRDGFHCQWRRTDDMSACGLAAYQSADTGVTTIYVKYINAFRAGSLSLTSNVQANVTTDFAEEIPAGTLVFDSLTQTGDPYTFSADASTFSMPGFLSTGGGKPFQITDQKTGSGLSLNTTRYVEMKQPDGTTIKLAVLN